VAGGAAVRVKFAAREDVVALPAPDASLELEGRRLTGKPTLITKTAAGAVWYDLAGASP
jgi:hypothetical protein